MNSVFSLTTYRKRFEIDRAAGRHHDDIHSRAHTVTQETHLVPIRCANFSSCVITMSWKFSCSLLVIMMALRASARLAEFSA